MKILLMATSILFANMSLANEIKVNDFTGDDIVIKNKDLVNFCEKISDGIIDRVYESDKNDTSILNKNIQANCLNNLNTSRNLEYTIKKERYLNRDEINRFCFEIQMSIPEYINRRGLQPLVNDDCIILLNEILIEQQ